MAKIFNYLAILAILLIAACSNIDYSDKPEGIIYVTILSKEQQESVNGGKISGCWLEFMLISESGRPVASEGNVTISIIPKTDTSKGYKKEFKVTKKDYREEPFCKTVGIKGNPICCLIGPLPDLTGPGRVINFEFQRPDGVIFRRKLTPPT